MALPTEVTHEEGARPFSLENVLDLGQWIVIIKEVVQSFIHRKVLERRDRALLESLHYVHFQYTSISEAQPTTKLEESSW